MEYFTLKHLKITGRSYYLWVPLWIAISPEQRFAFLPPKSSEQVYGPSLRPRRWSL